MSYQPQCIRPELTKVVIYLPATGCSGEIVLMLISEQLVTLLVVLLDSGDSLLKELGRGSEDEQAEVVVTAVRSGPHGRSEMSIKSMMNIGGEL